MPNLKFIASTVLEIWGPKILKVGHVTPSRPPFDLILHFLPEPVVVNLLAKFEVSIFNYSRDMDK